MLSRAVSIAEAEIKSAKVATAAVYPNKKLAFLELHPNHTFISIMDKRTGESPMEFEWETKAPGDASSPFFQLGAQHKKRAHSSLSTVVNPANPPRRTT
jgi:hypothetical protein